MPQVPYNPIPQAAQGTTLPEVHIDMPEGAFGAGVARAISGFGRDVAGAGEHIFQRAMQMQAEYNQAEARKAAADYTIEVGKISTQFNLLEGQEAVKAQPAYTQAIRQARDKFKTEVASKQAQTMYDNHTFGTMTHAIVNGASHSATQNKAYVSQSYDAARVANLNQVSKNPDDEFVFTEGIRRNEELVRQQLRDKPPGVIQNAVDKGNSSIMAERIIELAKSKPFEATEMFEKLEGNIWYEDKQKIQNALESARNQVGARSIAQAQTKDLYSDNRNKPPERGLEDRVKSAVAEAERLRPGDEEFKLAAEQATRVLYTRRKQDIKDTETENVTTVTAGIIGDFGDKIPTTPEELKALDPAVAKAYDALPAPQRKKILNALAHNVRNDFPKNEVNYHEYLRIRGMATSEDPKDREEFRSTSVVEMKIPREWRSILNRMQEAMIRAEGGDVQVTKYYKQLQAQGIAPDPKHRDDTLSFRGGIQAALEVFKEKNSGRLPNHKEIKEIGNALINQQTDETRWNIPFRSNDVSLYRHGVPPADENAIKDAFAKGGNNNPTSEQIHQVYLQKKFKELWGGTTRNDVTVPTEAQEPSGPQGPVSQ